MSCFPQRQEHVRGEPASAHVGPSRGGQALERERRGYAEQAALQVHHWVAEAIVRFPLRANVVLSVNFDWPSARSANECLPTASTPGP